MTGLFNPKNKTWINRSVTAKGIDVVRTVAYYRAHPDCLPDNAPKLDDPKFPQWVCNHMPVIVYLKDSGKQGL